MVRKLQIYSVKGNSELYLVMIASLKVSLGALWFGTSKRSCIALNHF